jgi:hypothetical protein
MNWISVDDRLPEKFTSCVIVFLDTGTTFKGVEKIAWAFFNSDGDFCTDNFKIQPTHWMPLPALPEGKK